LLISLLFVYFSLLISTTGKNFLYLGYLHVIFIVHVFVQKAKNHEQNVMDIIVSA